MTVQVSGTNERFLRKTTVLPGVIRILEPTLYWTDVIPRVRTETGTVRYRYESVSASGDTKKETPPIHTPTARFPKVDKTDMSIASAVTREHGFEIDIDRKAVTQKDGINELVEAYETAAFWIAEYMNSEVLSALTAGATSSFTYFSPSAVWSDASALPIADLMALADDMDREGYPFTLTDVYMNTAGFRELRNYLTFYDSATESQRKMFGVPQDIQKESIYIPAIDATVHKVKSGMTDSYVLGIDRNQNVATTFYFTDDYFSQANVSYTTVIDGSEQRKTVANPGIHYHSFFDDHDHVHVMQFWMDNVTKVKKPYGVLYGSGI